MPRTSEPRTRVEPGTYDWFQQELGRYLAMHAREIFDAGPNPAGWTPPQKERVHQIIQQGEHEFYHTAAHNWTFLTPELVVDTANGQHEYEMPEDFGGVTASRLMFDREQSAYGDVIKVDPRAIRDNRSYETPVSSFPSLFAEEVKPHDGQSPQLWHLMLWPTPNGEYRLRGRYRVEPVYMSSDRQYPYGGPGFQQALLYAMRAAAERLYVGTIGVEAQAYVERLSEAIARDSRDHGPATLGYNGNSSAARSIFEGRDHLRKNSHDTATYAGTNYGSS